MTGADLLSSGADREPRRLPRWVLGVLLGVGVLAGAAFALGRADEAAGRPPELVVLDDGIGVTTSGVIVVSVELRDSGGGLTVRSAELTAAPVLQPASVNAPGRVRPGGTARLVAILQPDCRALGPDAASGLDAQLVVRTVEAAGGEREVRLDLGSDPVVLGRLRGLCADRTGGRGGPSVGFLNAGYDRVEATVGIGGGARTADSVDGGLDSGVELRSISAPGLRFAPLGSPLPARIAAGQGAGLPVEVTVTDCTAVSRPPAGTDPAAHVWGWPDLELVQPDGTVTRTRPEPAAVTELYSTAVRRIVENACDGPPR